MPNSQEASGSAGGSARATLAPSRYFPQTAGITPEQRAEGVKRIVGVAGKARAHHRRSFFQRGIF